MVLALSKLPQSDGLPPHPRGWVEVGSEQGASEGEDPPLVPSWGDWKYSVATCRHHGLKESLLDAGGCPQPRISAGGCEHPTRTPSELNTLGETTRGGCNGALRGAGDVLSHLKASICILGYRAPSPMGPSPPVPWDTPG